MFILNHLKLGSRELGWEAWTGKEVIELTSSAVTKAIKSGEDVRGLQIGKDGTLELDQKFFTTNIMEKAHIGNYTPMVKSENDDITIKNFYTVLGQQDQNGKKLYSVITSRFAREEITEEELKRLYSLGVVSAGVHIENGKVTMPDYSNTSIQGVAKPTKSK